jgi:glycosyltransferase involved in cell wall biosynthesis
MSTPPSPSETPGAVQPALSVIFPTLSKVATVVALAHRVAELLPQLSLEFIIITPQPDPQLSSSVPIRLVNDVGKGVYAAYMQGIRSARGEYVWLLGDDDYPLDGLASLHELLALRTFDLIIAPVIFSSGRFYRPPRTRFFLLLRNWCQQGVIYRRAIFDRRRFYRRLKIQADHHMNLLLRADRSITRVFVGEPLCVFGVGGISSRIRDEHFWRLRPRLARRTLGPVGLLLFWSIVQPFSRVKRLLRSGM